MLKLLTFDGYDNRSGPHIFPIEEDRQRTIGHIKMARALPPRIEHYIKTAQPQPGITQLLIDALGAGEYWGSNSNGDSFPEEALRHEGPDYGHETFIHHGHLFRNHVNKDPMRAFGRVSLSDYDGGMHRVVLIVNLKNDLMTDVLERINGGEYPAVSMGCKVPYDVCSICNNKAKTRAEYCPHLRYQMNRILDDGRRVCAINTMPKFFDISIVPIGADKAAFVLQKVAKDGRVPEILSSAEAGEKYYADLLKRAQAKRAEDKQAEIAKNIPMEIIGTRGAVDDVVKDAVCEFMNAAGDVKGDEPELPPALLEQLGQHPLDETMHTLAALGMDLRPQEFQHIVLSKMGMAKMARELERRRLVFDERTASPTPPPWAASWLTDFHPNEKVALLLQDFVPHRSCYPEVLSQRIERLEKTGATKTASQWWPMNEEQKRQASGVPGLVPASLALASGFYVFKKLFPQLIDRAPVGVRVLARLPWLLPILAGAGVGATQMIGARHADQPLGDFGTGRGLDGISGHVYDGTKTAAINPRRYLTRLGLIPLAYIYSGIQQRKWQSGHQLNAFERLAATRPELLAFGSVAAAPIARREMARLVKTGGVMGDMALYALGSPAHAMPLVLSGALVDSLIFRGIGRLARRKKETADAHAQ